ncbi:MAG: hypothetical protein JNK78_05355 [Planctomycetes bacterium]|nr:hypothetical protein [Planctomycetota bacterium]
MTGSAPLPHSLPFPRSCRRTAALLACAVATLPLRAQGGAWATDTAAPGLGGRVDAFVEWQGGVYAGGTRFGAEGGWIDGLARWDGTRWNPVGTGVQLLAGQPFVHVAVVSSLCEWNGDLVVAGTFDRAGGQPVNHIARWDGASFHPMGQGLVEIGGDAEVRSLAVFNNELYVAGRFDTAGGLPAPGIARWNGTNWSPCGSGLANPPAQQGEGYALLVRGTELWVGGEFTSAGGVSAANVARWNGATFVPAGAGLGGRVMSLAEFAGQVCAGGVFDSSGATPTGPRAAWNGSSWQSIGPVVSGENPIALCSHGGALYAAGGWLSSTGGFFVPVTRWDGAQWTEVGGVAGELVGQITPYVQALASIGNELWVGGNFTRVGTPPLEGTVVASTGVATFDGAAWQQRGGGLGIDGTVAKMIPWRNGWVAVGNFASAGSAGAKHCAFFDGDRWQRLGSFDYDVLDAVVFEDDLVVMGAFTAIDGAPIARMARLHDATWSAFGGGFGPGVYPPLATHDGNLYAGLYGQLQRWNGVAFTTVATVSGSIDDLHVHSDGNLYFTTATWNQHLVFRWNGATATQIGTANSFTRCLGSHGGDLLLGGTFTAINGTPANLLARWNGSAWSSAGVTTAGYSVDATAELDGQLYIGVNSGATTFVQRWNGSLWQSLGSGLGGAPQCLFADPATSSVRAFGAFFEAGGKPVWNYAEWRNRPRWQNRLHGLAGAAGIPLLRGNGTLLPGSAFELTTEGPANHLEVLALGLSRVHLPLFDGVLIPSPDILMFLGGDSLGVSSFALAWPPGLPPGFDVFAQAWLLDPTGPVGWTASNALQATTP